MWILKAGGGTVKLYTPWHFTLHDLSDADEMHSGQIYSAVKTVFTSHKRIYNKVESFTKKCQVTL